MIKVRKFKLHFFGRGFFGRGFIKNAFLIYLKISKKLKQNCFVYISMFYVPTKLFQQKPTFSMIYVKMAKFGTKIGLLVTHVFLFFA
jgi:hypothetical protein